MPRSREDWGGFLLDTALCTMFFIVVVRQFILHDPPLPHWVVFLPDRQWVCVRRGGLVREAEILA